MKLGWEPHQFPDKMIFIPICKALKSNGYSVERAASLWNDALHNDISALRQLAADSGVYGEMYIRPGLSEMEADSEIGEPDRDFQPDDDGRSIYQKEWDEKIEAEASTQRKKRRPKQKPSRFLGISWWVWLAIGFAAFLVYKL